MKSKKVNIIIGDNNNNITTTILNNLKKENKCIICNAKLYDDPDKKTYNEIIRWFDEFKFKNTSGLEHMQLKRVIRICLAAKENDVIKLSYPEHFLHNKRQAQIYKLLNYCIKKNVYVVIKTNSQDLITSLRYNVYDCNSNMSQNDIMIYHNDDYDGGLNIIGINNKGEFINAENKVIKFPAGFFDVTLDKLIMLG